MNFFLLLILINLIFFLPRYLAGFAEGYNPFRFLFDQETIARRLKSFYYSRIIDPFRISLEYSLVVLLLGFLGMNGTGSIVLTSILALVVLVVNIYIAIFLKLLNRTPILRSDWIYTKENAGIYEGYFLPIGLVFIVLIAGFFSMFYYLNAYLLSLDFNPVIGGALFVFIACLGLFNTKIYLINNYLSRTVFSLFIYLSKSRHQTKKSERYFSLSLSDIKKSNHFDKVKLNRRPNIHIISMESYGSLIYRDLDVYAEVKQGVEKWNEVYNSSDIHCCSVMAEPPHFGSGTLYSYSTLLFGMKIENSYQYNILFNELATFSEYQSLFRYTRDNGYKNFVLQGMVGEFGSTVNYKMLKNNLTYDHIIQNDDIGFKGQYLKFMSMQKCPPDQFTFNKGIDVAQQSKVPYTLFYCTLNSHFDFDAPLEPVEEWEDLNDEHYVYETTMEKPWDKYKKYKKALNYSIDSIFGTIKKRINEDDIYVVYGDHQPTLIVEEKHGIESPIHIFSKNKTFIKAWEQYGFNEGLVPEDKNKPLKFEAFYSAFMNCLNTAYGQNKDLELPFFGDGIAFFNDN